MEQQYFPEISGLPRRPENNPRGYRSPEERQLPYESHMITCSDGVHIHAWLLHAPVVADWTQRPTILFFHGNAGNIGLRIPNAVQMLQQLGSNVLMVEYRGYGNSDSVAPNEAGLQLDAQAALLFAHQHAGIDSNQIFLFGRSLGGSVAIYLAHAAVQRNLPMAGVIVENTFTSISNMVDVLMPFLKPIKPYVLRIGWNSAALVSLLGQNRVPILFLAGAKDELVPHRQMVELYNTALQSAKSYSGNEKKELIRMHVIPDGTHNESWLQGGYAYWDAIRNFMTTTLQEQKVGGSMVSPVVPVNTDSAVDNVQSSSIPTMSSRFTDMAKDAMSNNNGHKKEL
jgi:abhydrolase domain-containing protein 13